MTRWKQHRPETSSSAFTEESNNYMVDQAQDDAGQVANIIVEEEIRPAVAQCKVVKDQRDLGSSGGGYEK